MTPERSPFPKRNVALSLCLRLRHLRLLGLLLPAATLLGGFRADAAVAGGVACSIPLKGTYDAVLLTAHETLKVIETRPAAAAADAPTATPPSSAQDQGSNASSGGGGGVNNVTELPLSSEGMFLYFRPTYSVARCDPISGTATYSLRVQVRGCDTFEAQTTPASPEACLASRGCWRNATLQCSAGGARSCLVSLLEALVAEFSVTSEGSVELPSLTVRLAPTDARGDTATDAEAEAALLSRISSCRDQVQGAAGSSSNETSSPRARLQSLRNILELLSQQVDRRFANVSDERPVAATAVFKSASAAAAADTDSGGNIGNLDGPVRCKKITGATSANGDGGDGPYECDTDAFYAFNTETTLYPSAADGSQVMAQRRFLVPTDAAYDSMAAGAEGADGGGGGDGSGGVIGFAAVGTSRTLFSPTGMVASRVDMALTERLVPASETTTPPPPPSSSATPQQRRRRRRLLQDQQQGQDAAAGGGDGGGGGSGDSSSGTTQGEAVTMRTRVLLTLTKVGALSSQPSPPPPPPASSRGARSPQGTAGTAGTTSQTYAATAATAATATAETGAQTTPPPPPQSTASGAVRQASFEQGALEAAVAASVDEVYPGGGFVTHMRVVKAHLAENSRRRRLLLLRRRQMLQPDASTSAAAAAVNEAFSDAAAESGSDPAAAIGSSSISHPQDLLLTERDSADFRYDSQYDTDAALAGADSSMRLQRLRPGDQRPGEQPLRRRQLQGSSRQALFGKSRAISVSGRTLGAGLNTARTAGASRLPSMGLTKVRSGFDISVDVNFFDNYYANTVYADLRSDAGYIRNSTGSYLRWISETNRTVNILGRTHVNTLGLRNAFSSRSDCNDYKDYTGAGFGSPIFSWDWTLVRVKVRFLVLTAEVSLTSGMSVYGAFGSCSYIGWPTWTYTGDSVGAGAALTGGLYGTASVGFDALLVEFSINARIGIIEPGVTGFALYTLNMAIRHDGGEQTGSAGPEPPAAAKTTAAAVAKTTAAAVAKTTAAAVAKTTAAAVAKTTAAAVAKTTAAAVAKTTAAAVAKTTAAATAVPNAAAAVPNAAAAIPNAAAAVPNAAAAVPNAAAAIPNAAAAVPNAAAAVPNAAAAVPNAAAAVPNAAAAVPNAAAAVPNAAAAVPNAAAAVPNAAAAVPNAAAAVAKTTAAVPNAAAAVPNAAAAVPESDAACTSARAANPALACTPGPAISSPVATAVTVAAAPPVTTTDAHAADVIGTNVVADIAAAKAAHAVAFKASQAAITQAITPAAPQSTAVTPTSAPAAAVASTTSHTTSIPPCASETTFT
ncbi:hypothetical protein PLESTB_001685900 [Pleodorina starrii]|uniref:Uncharacterized protein n=1 Tax=Pleodorina starrii TaxID=330485 RepID=A0A9W6BZ74_9CHLO|nr:hypothetical protein PLESTB_001685900 [Pleodorina starrii]